MIIRLTLESGKRIRVESERINTIVGTRRKDGSTGSMVNMMVGGTLFAQEAPHIINRIIRKQHDQTELALH